LTLSSLGAWLRQVLNVRRDWPLAVRVPAQADSERQDLLWARGADADGLLADQATFLGRYLPELPTFEVPAVGTVQVVLPPVGQETVVILTVLGMHLPVTIVAPHGLPRGDWAPVAFSQSSGRPASVTDVGARLREQLTADHAMASADRTGG